jgi:hypothetical protein
MAPMPRDYQLESTLALLKVFASAKDMQHETKWLASHSASDVSEPATSWIWEVEPRLRLVMGDLAGLVTVSQGCWPP